VTLGIEISIPAAQALESQAVHQAVPVDAACAGAASGTTSPAAPAVIDNTVRNATPRLLLFFMAFPLRSG
jgi:hypothetical protein